MFMWRLSSIRDYNIVNWMWCSFHVVLSREKNNTLIELNNSKLLNCVIIFWYECTGNIQLKFNLWTSEKWNDTYKCKTKKLWKKLRLFNGKMKLYWKKRRKKYCQRYLRTQTQKREPIIKFSVRAKEGRKKRCILVNWLMVKSKIN